MYIILVCIRTCTGGVTGGDCIESCDGMSNGEYQSCEECTSYIQCTDEASDIRQCEDGQTWDDTNKECSSATSTTCFTPGPPFTEQSTTLEPTTVSPEDSMCNDIFRLVICH